MSTNFNIVILVLLIGYFLYRKMKGFLMSPKIDKLLQDGALIIDVRTPQEFKQKCNEKSVNIPLDQLGKRINELDPSKPTIVCCASGIRSGSAVTILTKAGFVEVVNAGPWMNTVRR